MAVGRATLARPAPAEGRPVTLRGLLEREGVFSWLMLAPGVLFLLAFVAYPFFYGIFLSLQERRVASPGIFVGLANFVGLAAAALHRADGALHRRVDVDPRPDLQRGELDPRARRNHRQRLFLAGQRL